MGGLFKLKMTSDSIRKRRYLKKRRKRRFLLILCSTIIAFFLITDIINENDSNLIQLPQGKEVLPISSNSVGDLENTDWKLLLVNYWNPIPEGYKVENLTELQNNQRVDVRIYLELQEMFDSAIKDGVYPYINSSFREFSQQQSLYDNKFQEYINNGFSDSDAKKFVQEWVAIPGTSEHELGLAVDIIADKEKNSNEQVYQWLNENSYKYGFILRYPLDKVDITGISYEPWHFRYVGKESAKEIFDKGICLEEYLGESEQ